MLNGSNIDHYFMTPFQALKKEFHGGVLLEHCDGWMDYWQFNTAHRAVAHDKMEQPRISFTLG